MLMRVRRFSSAAVAQPAAGVSRWTRFLKGPAIEDMAEMRTLQSVERIAGRIPAEPVASSLRDGSFRAWLKEHCAEPTFASRVPLNQATFDALIKDVSAFIREKEDMVLREQPMIPAGVGDAEEDLTALEDAYVEAAKLKLARHKCEHISKNFALLDKDNDGNVDFDDVEEVLSTLVEGGPEEWLRFQFRLYDSDSDNVVTEDQSTQALDSMVLAQKAALEEFYGSHVENMPKKHLKAFEAAVNETNWKEKIPEKIRCVYHFSPKEEEDAEAKIKTIHWESFEESQKIEFPELHDMFRVYAKGFYDERYVFYERAQDKRTRRIYGILLAITLGVGDFVFAIV